MGVLLTKDASFTAYRDNYQKSHKSKSGKQVSMGYPDTS